MNYKPDSKSFFYRFIRLTGKFVMAMFFRKIELRHGENIPERGPVVFVANHPNSIMDAFVIGVAIKRKLNYIGHSGLFHHPIADKFLRSCGVIPVVRRGESSDKIQDNASSFEACYTALEEGQTIGIFPEGTSDMLRQVKKVKTGAARIILETESRNQYALGITVIPIGLHFFSRSRFRSRVLVNIGKPLNLVPYFEVNKSSNADAVQSLTNEIQRSLEELTVNISHLELDDLVRDVEVIYREELMSDPSAGQTSGKSHVEEFIITQRIAECVEYYYACDPDRVRAMQERLAAYKRKLKRLNLRDAMLQEKTVFSKILLQSARKFALALLGLPVALYGILNNFIPHGIAIYFAKRFLHERTKILTALMLAGGLAFLAFYTAQVYLVHHFFENAWALIYFISLPTSGLFALAYVKDLRDEQEKISFSFVLFTNRQLINKMRRERRLLIAEMDTVKEEYLKILSSKAGKES
jgi:glycerol-3-phosphate O-acyltransferase/dihydroxyacetone phosphate acyltransferase